MPLFRKRRGPSAVLSRPDDQDKPAKTSHSIRAHLNGKKTWAAAHRGPTPALPNSSGPSIEQDTTTLVFIPSLSKPKQSLLWPNVNPPIDFLLCLNEKALEQQVLLNQPRQSTKMIDTSRTQSPPPLPANLAASLLPGYNDVSGSVIVDWNGYPHFLSPQEEQDRKLQLERAVEERMLGLPRRTDFAWERPCHQDHRQSPSLPRYTPGPKQQSQSRSPQSTSSHCSVRR
ncbi:uncharacterized protein BO97DRAFT_429872 [Aspergillus homomorphus CBS 101889]|uniref:Uncharacterized protein n=1 Tax=Aspergillus homomorphus (strain CBS 101889) TaxID=1450537 RepID=A0A395HH74_ASPHC|nr:hypothetical protein BO97DRAFT_429872 [Aspergillus homomorphus CBS 101889]RAL06843.1 hypothetical protein BO97DRAFT_429872 [Aspergillus homomorphus CBS 101889]